MGWKNACSQLAMITLSTSESVCDTNNVARPEPQCVNSANLFPTVAVAESVETTSIAAGYFLQRATDQLFHPRSAQIRHIKGETVPE